MKRHWYTELAKVIIMAAATALPVILLTGFTARNPLSYGDDELAYYLWNRDVCEAKDTRYYSALILGDSSANAAYLPEYLSEGTMNLSLGGTTAAENYYVLVNWLENHEAPKTVFLSFMDYHMLYDNMFYERTVYSHLLKPEQEREILQAAETYGEENIACENARLKLFEYDHWLPNYYLPALLNAGFTGRRESNQIAYDSINLHRGAYIGLTPDLYSDTDANIYDSYSVNPFFDYYYRKILDLCKEHAIHAVIVSLPKTGNSVLLDSFRSARDGYYEALCAEYPTASYEAEVDTLPTWMFHDWEHVNLYGAITWSNHMRQTHPEAFPSEPASETTRQGIMGYMNTAETAEGLLLAGDERYYASIAITDRNLSLLEGFEDTGLTVKDRHVYVRKGADLSVTVQEANEAANGLCIWTEPDGSNSIVSHGTVYSIVIDPFADLTLLLIDKETHMPYVRNYMRYGDGLIGHLS